MNSSVIPPEAVRVEDGPPLGAGAFGVVYRARYANELVVVKRLKLQSLSKSAEEEFKKEATILSSLNHPRIVRFLGISLENERCSIILEYLPLGSLYTHYTKEPKVSVRRRLQLAADVATGMEFLHQRNPPILHNDLKSPNILLYHDATGALHAKITDFGVAKIKTATLTTTAAPMGGNGGGGGGGGGGSLKGTLLWMAPELHNLRAKYRTTSDVYAFGVVMTELTTWVGPFGIPIPDIRYDEIHRLLTVEKRIPVIRHSPDIPEGIQQLIERCLEIQQASRPSFSDVLAILEALTESTESDRTGSGNSVRSNASFRVSETMLEERESSTLSAMGGWTGSPRVAVNDTFDFRVAETAVLERDGSASSLSTYGGAALSRSASSSGTSRGSGVQGLENRMGNLHLNSPPATPNRLSTSSSSSSSSYSQNQLFSPVSSTSSSASSSNTLFPPPSLSRSTSNPGLRRAPSPSPIINPSSSSHLVNTTSSLDTLHTLHLATLQENASTLESLNKVTEHGQALQAIVVYCQKHFGDDLKTFTAVLEYAEFHENHHDSAVAIQDLVRSALDRARIKLGNDHRVTISLIGIMGGIYVAQDLTTPGLVLLLERLERCQKVFGENDPDTLHAGVAVVLYLTANGESAGAETLIRKIATRAAKTYGEGEAATIHAQMILGVVLVENGRWAEAEGVLFKVLAKRRNDDGGDELNFVVTLQSLAKALWKQLKFDAAESMLLEAVMKAKGMDEEWAEELMKEVETVRKLKKYQGHVESLEQQAKLCVQMGKYEMAEAVMGLCVEVNVKVYGDKHEKTLESRKVLEEMKKKGQQKKVGTTSVNVLINTAKAAPAAKKKKRNFFGL